MTYRSTIGRRIKAARAALARTRSAVTPGRRAWRGAALGLALTTTTLLWVGGAAFVSGRGALVDALTAVVVGWLAIAGLGLALLIIVTAVRWIPLPLLLACLAATAVLAILFSLTALPFAPLVAALLLSFGALAGAGTLSLVSRTRGSRVHRMVAIGGLLIGGLGLVAAAIWMLPAPDPVDPGGPRPEGPYVVRTMTYGSGAGTVRPEFGSDVDVRTPTVDGTPFLDGWSGVFGDARTAYWGHGHDELPLNATVWYPEGADPGPLVLIVHGNAPMEIPSDRGYGWLAEELASRGYVVASVDQTFLNISYTRGLSVGTENDARAWLLLEHLRLWRSWERDSASPLHGIADLDRIALIGHSRGGEAVATAAYLDRLGRYPEDASVRFDAAFGIDAVVAFAPIDGQYEPAGRPVPLRDTSYLAIHGGLDGDVFLFAGLRQYHRTSFSGDRFGLRMAAYLPDANHGQFNTEWGRHDYSGLAGSLLDTGAIMPPLVQRTAARELIVPFLAATLRGELDGLPALTDVPATGTLADVGIVSRYADSTETDVANFDEDADPASGTLPGTRIEGTGLTVWREEPAPLRFGEQGTNAAVIGWDRRSGDPPPRLSIDLPHDWTPPADPIVTMTLVSTSGPVDLTVEVIDRAGETIRVGLEAFGGVPPEQRSRRFKAPLPEWARPVEPIARTFRLRLADRGGASFDLEGLQGIRLVFEGTASGTILVDDVGVGSGSISTADR